MYGFSGINPIADSYSKPQRVECLAKNEKPKVIRDKGKKRSHNNPEWSSWALFRWNK